MMEPNHDISKPDRDHVEHLICRMLDREITRQQQAELDAILTRDPDARAMLDDYKRDDRLAAEALRQDVHHVARSRRPARRHSGFWIAGAGAITAAAAVVALSFLPDLWSNGRSVSQPFRGQQPLPAQTMLTHTGEHEGIANPFQQRAPRFVDYRDYSEQDYRPYRRHNELRRDWIGIPTADENVILIIERDRRTTTIAPISGSF
ncbi:MAG: hypothetical protein ABII12_06470 [Planctomycetota bacterium]